MECLVSLCAHVCGRLLLPRAALPKTSGKRDSLLADPHLGEFARASEFLM